MKKIVIIGLLLALGFVGFSQGIKFNHNMSFMEAKMKAKSENKVIFVDVYTAWCGPCKMLAKTVFTDPAVGSYFNEHFVAIKIDAEKGEGPVFAKKNDVGSYPTLLFFDKEGNLKKARIGAMSATELVGLGKFVIQGEGSFVSEYEEYKNGNHDKEFLKSFLIHGIEQLSTSSIENLKKDLISAFNVYYKQVATEEFVNKEGLVILSILGRLSSNEKNLSLILDNFDKFESCVQKGVFYPIVRGGLRQIILGLSRRGNINYKHYVEEGKKNPQVFRENNPISVIEMEANINFAMAQGDYLGTKLNSEKYFKTVYKNGRALVMKGGVVCSFFLKSDDKNILKMGYEFAKTIRSYKPTNSPLIGNEAKFCYKLGKVKEGAILVKDILNNYDWEKNPKVNKRHEAFISPYKKMLESGKYEKKYFEKNRGRR
jgi:thioredoxin-related protein